MDLDLKILVIRYRLTVLTVLKTLVLQLPELNKRAKDNLVSIDSVAKAYHKQLETLQQQAHRQQRFKSDELE